ncbi:MAG TPA: redoxin domain-containing protein [Pyrinomonadaceae bacterium]|nr:redoxin domain-containing protein [Pyrinomonadaceae bacterium]
MRNAIAILSLLVLFGPVSVVTSQSDWEAHLTKGHDLLRRGLAEDALKSFKRANEMQGKKCAECLSLMAEAYIALEAYKNVVETADKVLELAGDDKKLAWKAYNDKGSALQMWAERKDQKKLQAAEAAFRQGLTIEGAPPVLHYNLGVTLLQLNRDPEGITELQQFIESEANNRTVENAKKLVANPRRARENYAPDFSFTSLNGEYVSLDDLRGKVVLIDFWGTWCGPCVQSVPDLRNLHKKYSKDPSFVLIGISSDRDDQVWREFTAENKMVWPQYRDKDRRILRAFNIDSYPTYVIIDHEGIVRHRSVGMSWTRAATLENEIRKQIKIIAKSAEAQ